MIAHGIIIVEKDGFAFGVRQGVILAGPALIAYRTGLGGPLDFCTLKIEPESFPPDKTLIVPDGQGAVIHLESSTNLLQWQDEWVNAYTNRVGNNFFRIRADRIP